MAGVGRIADELAAHIRDRVLTGSLHPGAPLPEAALATEYDVARPTARTAIDLLVSEGLLVRKPHLPPQVRVVDVSEISEILRLLEVSEELALTAIFEHDADPRPLRKARKESTYTLLQTLVDSSGSARLSDLHLRCTYELLLASNNLPLAPSASTDPARDLVSAVSTFDNGGALDALSQIQLARRQAFVAAIAETARA